ncbi:hypothetical protein J1N35_011546 [Gossypium stocksii]|uniref:Aminotransferase-like plant mobile domain-containing protein n=1 Tax=Gossypium stocksii TaxID=47602 RepID=A0A9D3W4F3_9ROSI|nr:hypothetical protein J1N35_011546 [Gossypium stocksii]
MAEDMILKMYINNLSEGALDVIYGHLRHARFLYVTRMLGGTKLDPPLISASVKRWRLETHTFHLSYVYQSMGKSLQGVISADWTATWEQLLGKVLNKFRGSRIKMRWLEDNFKTIEASASDVKKQQFMRTFILRLIEGMLMWLLLLVDLKEAGRLSWGSMVLKTLYQEMFQETKPKKKLKSTVAHSFNRVHGIDYHFYASEWTSIMNSHS